MDDKERTQIHTEINPQLWILNAVNRAIMIRQQNKDQFPDAVSGTFLSLFPDMQNDLINKLDEKIEGKSAREIRDFNEDGFETSYDLQACIRSEIKGTKKEIKIKAAEVLLNKIKDVCDDWGFFSSRKEMPTYGMKKRRVSGDEQK